MAKRGKQYWLFKSEPEVYAIGDLEREGRTTWEGIRNYQARNLLRDEVEVGDQVLFYHSRTQPIGVAGVAEVVKAGYPDPFQFDAKSKYHDPKSDPDDPRWITVDIAFVRAFDEVVPLTALKADKRLAKMMVTQRGARLSIQPVTPAEFQAVLSLAP